jgi:hypothetical protein
MTEGGGAGDGRAQRLVTGVLAELLRSSEREGFVLSGAGPEVAVLKRWLDQADLPFLVPEPEAVSAARSLQDSCASSPDPDAQISFLAGHALATARGFIHAGPHNKTQLLLDPNRPPYSVFPLGDVFASEIGAWVGEASLPASLKGSDPRVVQAVDQALDRFYNVDRSKPEPAFGLDPTTEGDLLAGWREVRKGWHSRPLIPKLGTATLGLDLDP